MEFKLHLVGLLLILLTASQAIAQEHFLQFAGGLRPEALRDAGYSPLRYAGQGLTGMLAYQKKSEKRETLWIAHYGRGRLSSPFDRKMQSTAAGILNLNFYSSGDTGKKVQWGWANNNQFHTRLIDDFQNFNGRTDFFTAFGPAMQYSLPLDWRQQRFTLQAAAHVQLIGFYVASGYVASVPPGFAYENYSGIQGLLRSAHFFFPGSAWNAAILPSFQWHLKSGNTIALNYWYEYTRLERVHRSSRSVGHWFVAFKMKL